MTRVPNKTGVISGATGFLGSLLAKHLAVSGHNLILLGRNLEKLEALKNEISKLSPVEVVVLQVDFESNFSGKVSHFLFQISNDINFYINTLGTQPPLGPITTFNPELWKRNIDINLNAPAILTGLMSEIFIKNNSGTIILVSGGGATKPRRDFSAYASAKTGLLRFVETTALELADTKIRINAVAPGVLPSKMMEEIISNSRILDNCELQIAQKAVKEKRDFDNLIELFNFLISDESIEITGKLISADWDNWRNWPKHIDELKQTDLYTLRRITGKDRGVAWGEVSD